MWFVVRVGQLSSAAVPVAGVPGVALDLVEHGVDPGARGVALMPLHDLVGGLPVAGERQLDGLQQILDHGYGCSFTRSLNTFRTFATFGAATAWQ